MDCKHFRKHHLAYLDDTLPGDLMAQAQRHVLECDGCAAHDTLVRRSLMALRILPEIEPSAAFQSRLRETLAACRAERNAGPAGGQRRIAGFPSPRFVTPTRAMLAMAASVVIGVMAWPGSGEDSAPTLAMRPVMAMPPEPMVPVPSLSPALMQVMATGNPVWPAAMLVEEAPVGFVNTEYRFADYR